MFGSCVQTVRRGSHIDAFDLITSIVLIRSKEFKFRVLVTSDHREIRLMVLRNGIHGSVICLLAVSDLGISTKRFHSSEDRGRKLRFFVKESHCEVQVSVR
ncbi:hypothetical protein R1flu_028944 [Riccia fluitans]|uniref:Uncharacterized protein n=1 Tax=Riccia fluitans TaxID=41844 RepID=A0ABD1XN59_9MARC